MKEPAPFESEEELVDWLLQRGVPAADDTATIEIYDATRLVFTTDSQVENTHFQTALDPWLVAQRLLRINLSDLAAAGAEPRWCTCNVNAEPAHFDIRRFLEGLLEECANFGVQLLGGDTARCATTSLSLTLVGERRGPAAGLQRFQARAGDSLWLAGPLAEAHLGLVLQERGAVVEWQNERGLRIDLRGITSEATARAATSAIQRHRLPEPQLEVGTRLAESCKTRETGPHRVPAAIDVSDGLLKDLGRLCRASGVGARLELEALAIAPTVAELAGDLGVDIFQAALAGGEDYALLFTLPPTATAPAGARRIGEIVQSLADSESAALDSISITNAGEPYEASFADSGWDHLRR